ncbi:O-antigen ligase family protein [Fructobacillus durionis]|uniref:O-antigen ligase family protein n=1 Tax=Fructobacillus durionis TaxID=283737 RepID=UPI001FCA7892|nr:hypothetical protein [Fructobacillus durionis]
MPSKTALALAGFFWVLQLGAMAWSYRLTGETVLTSGLIHSVIVLTTWSLTVYIAWATIEVTVTSEQDEKKFVKSGLIALAIYLLLVVLPQILVTLNVHRLNGYVNHLASLFERRWRVHGPNYDFYRKGSYVTSQHRVNGFEPEAAFLANLLGVVYLPILIGLTATGQKFWNWTKSRRLDLVLNVFFALTLFGILLLAKTTTGILTAVIAFVLWIIWSKGGMRAFLVTMAVLGILLGVAAYIKVPTVHNLLNQFLFAKGGTDNRLGGTIGLLLTFLTHPIFGVGYGYTSFFTIQNVPEYTTRNYEFQHVYSQFGYPNLSDLLGWFASFGLIVMIPAIFLLVRLVARTYLVRYRLNSMNLSAEQQQWTRGLVASFITMIILAAFSSIFVIQVFLWPYLLMFFFYRKHMIRLEKELK